MISDDHVCVGELVQLVLGDFEPSLDDGGLSIHELLRAADGDVVHVDGDEPDQLLLVVVEDDARKFFISLNYLDRKK